MFRGLLVILLGVGTVIPLFGNAALPALRISVEREGPCLVPVSTLAQHLALSADEAAGALSSGALALSRGGRAVGWLPSADGLVFYGRASGSVDSRETVYRLQAGGGLAPETEDHSGDGVEAGSAPISTVPAVRHLESNSWCSLQIDSRAGFGWMTWQLLSSTRIYEFACDAPGHAGTGPVTLTVSLRSFHPEADPDGHRYGVAWNGQPLGAVAWSNQQSVLWQGVLPAGSLSGPAGGTVALTKLTDATAVEGRASLEWIELAYLRTAQAEGGVLAWNADSAAPVVAGGFPEEQVESWDVTEPDRPVRLAGVPAVPRSGAFAVGFRPAAGRRYAVFSRSGLRPPAGVRADEAQDLTAATNSADWVIVVPPLALADFRDGARRLADFRAAQGLETRLVSAEAVADTFDGGQWTTGAIHRFVSATAGWARRPRYVVLAGYGNLDYRFGNTKARCLIPAPGLPVVFKIGDRMGEIMAADASYGDDDGDGVPEVAVGRIPAMSAGELAVAVGKIIGYERALAGKGNALFTADNPTRGVTEGINLHTAAEAAAGLAASGGYAVLKAVVPETEVESRCVRPAVLAALSNTPAFYLHLGHGDYTQIGANSVGNGILTTNMLSAAMPSWNWPGVGLIPSCHINRFHHPAMTDAFCLESFRRPNTGFAALWAPSCTVRDDDGVLLGQEIARAWAVDAPLRLGEAVRLAASRVKGRLAVGEVLKGQTLLGDPATVIRLGKSARDVPTDWLLAHGLTEPNAEEGDGDGDSFPAWAEYALGTDPASLPDHPLGLRRIEPAGERLALRFASGPGSRYRVLRSGRVGNGPAWTPCPMARTPAGAWLEGGSGLTATGLESVVYVPVQDAAGFFKIEALP